MEQENQTETNSGSKKGKYILIGIIIFLILGWVIKSSVYMMTGVDVDANKNGSATYSTKDGTVSVGTNKLPDNWPSDAPKYANGTIQYSGSSNPQTGAEGAVVMFITKDSSEKVVNFYKKELASNGWTIEQTVNSGPSTIFSAKKDTRTFGAYIIDSGEDGVSVSVTIEIPKTAN